MPTLVHDPLPPEFEALLERRRRLGQDLLDEVCEGVRHMSPAPSGKHARIEAQLFAERRDMAAGSMFAPLDDSFPKSGGLAADGNISIVQVVDQRFPWIYNEDGDIGFNFHAYTTGIANGIEPAAPVAPCLRPNA